jgi:pimeloyl-ACP methyl ester carboxylesterase
MPKDLRGGHPTYWTTFGHGPRKALLIHCSLAHSGAWNRMAALFEDKLEMRAFDLPGHGKSDDWPPDRDMQALSVAMAADVIGRDGPMDIIGHSFGATVALRLAILHPGLVRSLVMIESVFVAAALADDPGLAESHAHLMKGYAEAVKRGDSAEAAREFMTEWGDGRPWESLPEAQRAFLIDRIHLIEANDATVMRDLPRVLERRLIEQVEAPALLIRGAQSSSFVEPIHAAIVRRMRHARDVAIEGAGHMVPITHPEAVAREIEAFLAELPEAVT